MHGRNSSFCSTLTAMAAAVFLAGTGAALGQTTGRVASRDGVEIAYTARGSGATTLLFIHGGLADRSFWAPQLDELSREFRVVAPDLGGHGESGRGRRMWTIGAWAEDVRAVADALQLTRIVLIGNSLGGPVALEAAALLRGRVLGVIGVDTLHDATQVVPAEQAHARAQAFRSDFAGSCHAMVATLFHPGQATELHQWAEKKMCATEPEVVAGMMEGWAGYDLAATFRAAGVPIRAINGDLWPTNTEGNRRVVPDFDATIMPATSHYPMLEHPTEFNRILVEMVHGLDSAPLAATKRPVADKYHGFTVMDDYRWLEDWSRREVQAWSEAQNVHARSVLDALPGREAIAARVDALLAETTPDYYALTSRGGVIFALKAQPPNQQAMLVALRSLDDLASERTVLDPNKLDPTGGTTIDFFEPSLDGRLIAVCLSEGGTENGTVRVVDTAKGSQLADRVPRVNGGTAGGSVAWTADGSGFYYTRYPAPGERPSDDLAFYQEIWFHRLGQPIAADRYVLGKELPRIAEIRLDASDDGRFVLATVANGDGGAFEHHLLVPGGAWKQLTRCDDGVSEAVFAPDGALLLLSSQNAPRRKVLRLPLATPVLSTAVTVVGEGEAAIDHITATDRHIVLHEQLGGPSRLRIFDLTGRPLATLPAPELASVGLAVRLPGGSVAYRVETFFQPPQWLRFDPATGAATPTALRKTSSADFSDCEVVRGEAVSRDGTRVPLSILRRRGTPLDGSNPTLLTGYGGFAVSTEPGFDPGARAWLEQGGVLAVANIRGGGELGEDWHRGGNLTRKQNVFDDFAACARFLIEAGYTRPARLAIEGGSNGGLLVGAMLTQHPELFGAVVAHVALLDMLRYERFANGQFNVTEYGTVANRKQFLALRAYSPYQNVVPGVAYPAVLFLTGANDPRVDPANSRTMTARLQACSSSGRPVLLRTSGTTGHIGTPLSARVAIATDVYAFLFHELGVTYRAVAGATAPPR